MCVCARVYPYVRVCVCVYVYVYSYHCGLRTSINDSAADEFWNS